jgi:hypothetical protein
VDTEPVKEKTKDWFMLYAALTVLLTLALSVIVNRADRAASDRRDCGNLRADIEAYRAVPPSTAAGVNVLRARLARYAELGCERIEPAVIIPTLAPTATPTQ